MILEQNFAYHQLREQPSVVPQVGVHAVFSKGSRLDNEMLKMEFEPLTSRIYKFCFNYLHK